ncbi:LPP20 family lipoprotein [Thalassotalea sp. LPB0316]|uniref:LPP20 family lipoprotein n=1 Tax=Thalassotalea sp. LPB0316 TaxID=2769490 RepID=UPI00186855E6|nr:LPP20 family lipoprotein [Thalassotalea sp. LPB0316]QOL25349.1 LPP20 family lipoprotein [Thalassotalea sp. LPB0316]
MKNILIALFLTAMVAGCSSVDKHVQYERVKPEKFPVLTAIGYAPISLQKSDNETQRMLMAINASKIAAYAELAEQVYGQQITGSTTMADLIVADQVLTAKIQGVIRGAKVIKSYPVGDTYTTELALDFEDVYHVYEVMHVEKRVKDVTYSW